MQEKIIAGAFGNILRVLVSRTIVVVIHSTTQYGNRERSLESRRSGSPGWYAESAERIVGVHRNSGG